MQTKKAGVAELKIESISWDKKDYILPKMISREK